MSDYNYLKPQAKEECEKALVEKLLDAAFKELQHDTGEHNPEWRYQRENLRAAFKRVLRVR